MTTKKSPKPKATKKDQLIRMLKTKSGADLATISGRLGWQRHTTRAAWTGLRKAGFTVTSETQDGGKPARYRIAAEPNADAELSGAAPEARDAG